MKSPPEKRLAPAVLEKFLGSCRMRECAPRSTIIKVAEIPDRLYYLVDGSVEVVLGDDTGREIVLAYLNRGHFFGEMGYFDEEARERSAWVRARTRCLVAELNYDRFTEIVAANPELVFEIATQLATRLLSTDQKLSDLAFLDVAGRVAHSLLDLCAEPDAEPHPAGRKIRVTRPQLARIVGCSREMVSRVLKTLQHEGLILDTGDGIVVSSPPERDPVLA